MDRCSTLPAVVIVDELRAELVRARDHGPAALTCVKNVHPVDLASHCVVDDGIGSPAPLYCFCRPCIDPEALDADDLLLLVTHRSGQRPSCDDDRGGDRLGLRLPAPVALVARDRDDDRIARLVRPGRDSGA